MLGYPRIPHYLAENFPENPNKDLLRSSASDNVMGADNQQERPITIGILRDCMPDQLELEDTVRPQQRC